MIDFEDFRKEDGDIDWKAYNEARVEAGEKCYRCGDTMIFAGIFSGLYGAKEHVPKRTLCGSCKSMDKDSGEVTHDNMIRCPHCGHQSDISQWDCDYGEEKYTEGEHEVYCDGCTETFTIQTHVSYSYTSPPMLEKGDPEGDDDEDS